MSVNNIVNMAKLKGLELIALTDHNSSLNCPAFLDVAGRAGIKAFAGMELNTLEEVHAVCLFRELDSAMCFDGFVYSRLAGIKNQPEIFGEQLIVDATDNPVGSVDKLLINATEISFFDLDGLMREYNGIYFPAHIDKSSFSLLANLGFVPPECHPDAFELKDSSKYQSILAANPALEGVPLLNNSDAHYLWDINEAEHILPGKVRELLGV